MSDTTAHNASGHEIEAESASFLHRNMSIWQGIGALAGVVALIGGGIWSMKSDTDRNSWQLQQMGDMKGWMQKMELRMQATEAQRDDIRELKGMCKDIAKNLEDMQRQQIKLVYRVDEIAARQK